MGARAGAGLTEGEGGALEGCRKPGLQGSGDPPAEPGVLSPDLTKEILSCGSADAAGWVQGLLSPTRIAHHQRSRMQCSPRLPLLH